MRLGIASLILAYVLSQFYRAFLSVMTPALTMDLGVTPEHLAKASGAWFLAFALMQIPVGWALDTIGPKKVTAGLLAIGGAGGATFFALATTPSHILIAMILLGIGCSPVLMASYYIFARTYSAAMFGTLAAMVISIGSLGNIASALPLAAAVQLFGWRTCVLGLAAISLLVSMLILLTVNNPPRVVVGDEGKKGSVLDLLKMPSLWVIFPLMFISYAPSAAIRGSWAGSFLGDIYGLNANGIGWVTLAMAVAMVIGSMAYGPLDRVFGTRKWVIFPGNFLAVICVFLLWGFAGKSVWFSGVTMVVLALAASSSPLIMAHARSFFPEHLVGRGVTLLNMFSIGGVGVFQYASAGIFKLSQHTQTDPITAYKSVFLSFAIPSAIGCLIYLLSQDRID